MALIKLKYNTILAFKKAINEIVDNVNSALGTNISRRDNYGSLALLAGKLNEAIDAMIVIGGSTTIVKVKIKTFLQLKYKIWEAIDVINTGFASTYRVRFGDGNLTLNNTTFVSDSTYWTSGTRGTFTDATSVANTIYDPLYQTEVFGANRWTFPVTNGNYTVYLHFNETFVTTSNARRFNVDINSVRRLNDFDVFTLAGGRFIALVRTFTFNVNTGSIILDLVTGFSNSPKINGFEIVKSGAPSIIPLG